MVTGCHEVHIQIERPSTGNPAEGEGLSGIVHQSFTDVTEDLSNHPGDTGWDVEEAAFTDGRTGALDVGALLDSAEEGDVGGVGSNGPPPGGPFAYITNNLGNSVHVIDTSNHSVVAEIEVNDGPRGVAIHPRGHRVYVGNYGAGPDGETGSGTTVSVIDTHTNTVIDQIEEIPGPEGLEIHPDGSRLYVTAPGPHILPPDGANDNVVVIDTESHEIISRIEVGDHPWGLEFNQEGSLLYVGNSHSESISKIDTQQNVVIQTVLVGDDGDASSGEDYHISMLRLDPLDEGRLYVVLMHLDLVAVIDSETLNLVESFDVWFHPHSMAFTPHGEKIFIPALFSELLWVIDPLNNNEVEMTVSVPAESRGVSVTPDGQWVYVVNGSSNSVSVFEVATNEFHLSIDVGRYPYGFGDFIYWP